jgi:hypothetical protein
MPASSVPPVLMPSDEKPMIVAAPSVQTPTPSSLPATSTAISVNQVPLQPLTTSTDSFSALQPLVRKDKAERAGEKQAQTSSYWSVPEQTDFPHLLAAYGTNWAAIAAKLASKTTVMVCSLIPSVRLIIDS